MVRDSINPLSANPTKWPNTLKQFVGKLSTNCLSVFDHFDNVALKGLTLNFKCPCYITQTKMKEFMSTIYSFDYNQNKEDERDESCSDDEIYLLINKS